MNPHVAYQESDVTITDVFDVFYLEKPICC